MKKLTVLLMIILLVFSSDLYSAEGKKQKRNNDSACKIISSSDAISRAMRKNSGKVVSVKLKRAGARSVYRVRMLVGKNRIKNITVNACR